VISVDFYRDHLSGLNDFPSPFQAGVSVPFAVANSQHPRFYFSPNDCSFSSLSNSFGLAYEVLVECSIVVHANVFPCSRSSNHGVRDYKKRGCFYSVANLRYNYASDTIFLPMDGTTSHRKICGGLGIPMFMLTSAIVDKGIKDIIAISDVPKINFFISQPLLNFIAMSSSPIDTLSLNKQILRQIPSDGIQIFHHSVFIEQR